MPQIETLFKYLGLMSTQYKELIFGAKAMDFENNDQKIRG